MFRRSFLAFCCALLILAAGGKVGAQATLEVPADFPTIQGAINASVNGDEIVLASGVYTGPGNVNLTYGGREITIRSATGNPLDCVIDCESNPNTRAFDFVSGETPDSVLDGITVRNGLMTGAQPNDRGGAFRTSFGSNPTIQNCIFEDNVATTGGALLVFQSTPLLIGCHFTGNGGPSASNGGAVCNLDGSVELVRCTFHDNSATAGGAISSEVGGVASLVHCATGENTSPFGGALFSQAGAAIEATNCIFWNDLTDGVFLGTGGTITITYSNVEGGWPGVGNINMDPLYVAPLAGDFHLQPGSPCIDAGNPASPLDPDGTVADMGAFFFSQSQAFIRGDGNGDGSLSGLADGVFILLFQFVPGSPAPPCLDAADFDDSGTISGLVDGLAVLNFQFIPGSPPPPTPHPMCGPDPTQDSLGCNSYPCP